MRHEISKHFKCYFLITILMLTFNIESKSQLTYYVSSTEKGTGDGSSTVNAAAYLNKVLWQKVQNELNSNSVTVRMLEGTYNSGTLRLNFMGNPMHKLVIQAETDYQVLMSVNSGISYIIDMKGTQNTTVRGIIFRGPCSTFAVACWAEGKKTARNLQFVNCIFENLTEAKYGALYLAEADNISLLGCAFNNVGINGGSHMIYSDKNCRNLSISNSSFTDCKGDYVRFRNETGFAKVDNCKFNSTNPDYNKEFILVPLFNDVNPGDEFFATDYQFTNNTFTYNTVGGRRHAIQFRCDGYNVPTFDGLDYRIDENESSILNNGTASQKADILGTKKELDNSKIKIYGNKYFNVDHEVVYWHHPNYGSPKEGFTGYCNITNWPSTSGLVAEAPIIINGDFEMKGYFLRNWRKPGVPPVVNKGLNGTATAALFNSSSSQELFQWLNNASSKWTMNCLFAVGASSETGVKFRIDIGHNELKDSRISFAINDQGQVGIFNDTSFVELPKLGRIIFSIDSNGDYDYSDERDKLRWYHLRISGNYSVGAPFVDISLSDENAMILKRYANHVSYWVNDEPVKNAKPGIVNFYSSGCNAIVDEVLFK